MAAVAAGTGLAIAAPAAGGGSRPDGPAGPEWACHVIDASSRGADGVKVADVNGDGLGDIATGWEEGGLTRVYLHPGRAKVKAAWPAVTVGRTPSVEDAAFVDLDADGAPDVVSCCEGRRRAVLVHWAPKDPADLLDGGKWTQAVLPESENRMQWMFAWGMQVDGRHGVDVIAGGKGKGAAVGWFEAPADPRDLKGWRWHPISDAGWIMSIWPRDVDGDGRTDVVVSDRYGPLRGCRWLRNPGAGPAQARPWANHFIGAKGRQVMSMALADLDADGLEDALVAAGGSRVLFLRRLDKAGRTWRTHEIGADFGCGNPRAVAVGDLNGDGRPDIALTTWNARGRHGVLWLEYRRRPTDRAWTPHAVSGTEKGIKYDRIELGDLDGDGDLDLLTCEESEGRRGLGVVWYENPSARRAQGVRGRVVKLKGNFMPGPGARPGGTRTPLAVPVHVFEGKVKPFAGPNPKHPQFVKVVRAGADGAFRVALPPGEYTVVAEIGGRLYLNLVQTTPDGPAWGTVTVKPGQWSTVNIEDTSEAAF